MLADAPAVSLTLEAARRHSRLSRRRAPVEAHLDRRGGGRAEGEEIEGKRIEDERDHPEAELEIEPPNPLRTKALPRHANLGGARSSSLPSVVYVSGGKAKLDEQFPKVLLDSYLVFHVLHLDSCLPSISLLILSVSFI